jgi:hypothetical protein
MYQGGKAAHLLNLTQHHIEERKMKRHVVEMLSAIAGMFSGYQNPLAISPPPRNSGGRKLTPAPMRFATYSSAYTRPSRSQVSAETVTFLKDRADAKRIRKNAKRRENAMFGGFHNVSMCDIL